MILNNVIYIKIPKTQPSTLKAADNQVARLNKLKGSSSIFNAEDTPILSRHHWVDFTWACLQSNKAAAGRTAHCRRGKRCRNRHKATGNRTGRQ